LKLNVALTFSVIALNIGRPDGHTIGSFIVTAIAPWAFSINSACCDLKNEEMIKTFDKSSVRGYKIRF
jgi:hypothetical protein